MKSKKIKQPNLMIIPDTALMMDVKVYSEYYYNHITFDCTPKRTDFNLVGKRGKLIFIPN